MQVHWFLLVILCHLLPWLHSATGTSWKLKIEYKYKAQYKQMLDKKSCFFYLPFVFLFLPSVFPCFSSFPSCFPMFPTYYTYWILELHIFRCLSDVCLHMHIYLNYYILLHHISICIYLFIYVLLHHISICIYLFIYLHTIKGMVRHTK